MDLDALRQLACAAALAAGEELLARHERPTGVDTKSSSGDFVSDADRAAEERIVGLLLDARPDDGLLGEEGADRPAVSGVRWVIDPLDGTTNYLYGLMGWSVSIAAEQRDGDGWEAVAAAVLDPLTGDLFSAARDGGARLGDTPLQVNDPVPLDRALVGTGFHYDREVRAREGRTAAGVLPHLRDLRRIGSAALDLSWVAAGRLDGFFEGRLAAWDMAAGILIAREAGAVVTPYEDGVLAAGPGLHPDLSALLAAVDGAAGPA